MLCSRANRISRKAPTRRECPASRTSRRAFAEIPHPGRIELLDGRQQTPMLPLRGHRYAPQCPPELSEQPVGLLWLHGPHAATQFSQECSPPRLRGMTWSTVSARPPQYAQRKRSRCMSAARVIGMRARYGTWTNVRSRITEGTTIVRVAEWITGPDGSSWTTSALPHITMITARRSGSAVSGS